MKIIEKNLAQVVLFGLTCALVQGFNLVAMDATQQDEQMAEPMAPQAMDYFNVGPAGKGQDESYEKGLIRKKPCGHLKDRDEEPKRPVKTCGDRRGQAVLGQDHAPIFRSMAKLEGSESAVAAAAAQQATQQVKSQVSQGFNIFTILGSGISLHDKERIKSALKDGYFLQLLRQKAESCKSLPGKSGGYAEQILIKVSETTEFTNEEYSYLQDCVKEANQDKAKIFIKTTLPLVIAKNWEQVIKENRGKDGFKEYVSDIEGNTITRAISYYSRTTGHVVYMRYDFAKYTFVVSAGQDGKTVAENLTRNDTWLAYVEACCTHDLYLMICQKIEPLVQKSQSKALAFDHMKALLKDAKHQLDIAYINRLRLLAQDCRPLFGFSREQLCRDSVIIDNRDVAPNFIAMMAKVKDQPIAIKQLDGRLTCLKETKVGEIPLHIVTVPEETWPQLRQLLQRDLKYHDNVFENIKIGEEFAKIELSYSALLAGKNDPAGTLLDYVLTHSYSRQLDSDTVARCSVANCAVYTYQEKPVALNIRLCAAARCYACSFDVSFGGQRKIASLKPEDCVVDIIVNIPHKAVQGKVGVFTYDMKNFDVNDWDFENAAIVHRNLLPVYWKSGTLTKGPWNYGIIDDNWQSRLSLLPRPELPPKR